MSILRPGQTPSSRSFTVLIAAVVTAGQVSMPAAAHGQAIVRRLSAASEQVELTVNTSRILTLEKKFTRAQVNNPSVLALTPLSPTQLQVAATKPGVTQVNMWDEDGNVFSVDVAVFGDASELELALKTEFPDANVQVRRYSNSLVLSGFVDDPDHVSRIVRLAEDYSPKVVNNLNVGGVQQIMLHVKVMEVSRTKLREIGFDFALFGQDYGFVSSISGLIAASASGGTASAIGSNIDYALFNGNDSFFAALKFLQQKDLMKILAEPKIVTVSGRPASFNVGGEFPITVPQSLGTVSIEYKKFGTQVDFVPLVLGNGNIRLEVFPRVSEIDSTRSVVVNNATVPGLRVREVNTGVEMKAGQTLALAGLVQDRIESQHLGVPYLSDLPYFGAAFRKVEERRNEVELLILVRPEFVDAMDAHEVPPGGPGTNSCSPTDHELFWKGHIEVPCCDRCGASACQGNCQVIGPTGQPFYGTPEGEVVEPMEPTPAAPEPAAPSASLPSRSTRPAQIKSMPSPLPRIEARQSAPRGRVATSYVASRPQPAKQTREVRPQQGQYELQLPTRYAKPTPVTAPAGAQQSPVQGPGMLGPVGYDLKR